MLQQLQIENVAIIDKLDISLDTGFNVLTGETGAGKSILIDSINALIGSRVSRELIRSGADKATVQGVFDCPEALMPLLEEYGIACEEGTLIISRSFTEAGKNNCRINGTIVTVAMLKEIGMRLVDIHGQHDNQSLLRTETHIGLLDLFAGDKLAKMKGNYQKELEALKTLKSNLKEIAGEGKERERLMDMLRFQIDEIEQVSPVVGEDEELERQSRILAHAEDIISAFGFAYQAVKGEDSSDEGAIDRLLEATEAIRKVETIDPAYQQVCASLEDLNEKLHDVTREIRNIRDSVEYDPKLHKSIEDRISTLQSVKKKYGETLSDVLIFLKESRKRLEKLERSEELISELNEKIQKQTEKILKLCDGMNQLRLDAAKHLEKGIMKELSDLEMPKTMFGVAITKLPAQEFTPDGTDVVEFMISPNPGEPLRPLSKIASGGEMSRVMLAVKSILAGMDGIPTLIFDEIDTGVSGKAAKRVGEKLKSVARNHQVLCITHHAQIASLANTHFFISKNEQAGRMVTKMQKIAGAEREDEITRLLSGEHVTDAARSLARELLSHDKKD